MIVRPSALLRVADIWELTNRARAYDNHVYVVGANATGTDPAGVLYFGNSMIVHPGRRGGRPRGGHECWVTARLDPATALRSLTPGSSVPQVFDHLADRNLDLIKRHLDTLAARAPPGSPTGGPVSPSRTPVPTLRPTRVARDPTHPDRHRHRRHVHRRRRRGRGHRRAGDDQDTVDARRPRCRLHGRRRQGAGACSGLGGDAVTAVSHGTTVATNKLLEGKVENLGLHHHRGLRARPRDRPAVGARRLRQLLLLGEAAAHRAGRPGQDRRRPAGRRRVGDPAVRRGVRASRRPGSSATAGIGTIGVCFLHSYANPAHERAMRDVIAREHPDAVVSISSEVLREYREYERSVTTLVDAAVKPNIRRYVANIAEQLDDMVYDELDHRASASDPVLRDEVQRRRALGRGGRAPADHHRAVRAGGRRARRRGGRRGRRLRPGRHLRRRRHVDRRHRRHRRAARADHRGHRRRLPEQDPDDRRRHRRRRRRVDRLDQPRGHAQGRAAVGRRRPRPDVLRTRAATEPTITDAHVLLGRIPPHLLGGEVPLDVDLAADGRRGPRPASSGLSAEAAATGILEISAWNQANALRQITVKRGLDVRDFHLVTFGGSGSLLACRLVDILGLRRRRRAAQPGQPVGVRAADRRRPQRLRADRGHPAARLDLGEPAGRRRRPDGRRPTQALEREGFAPAERRFERTADLRYFGQAYEVRVRVADGAIDARTAAEAVADAFHDEHRRLYGYDFRDDARQEVEWVNLRVTGVGPIRKPELARSRRARRRRRP